jgi:hypothetical protein
MGFTDIRCCATMELISLFLPAGGVEQNSRYHFNTSFFPAGNAYKLWIISREHAQISG